MLSKACKHGIRASIFLASKADKNVKLSVKEIAAEIEAPPAFTAKILQILTRFKIVTSLKGPYGGFYCEKEQLDLPVLTIVHAIDGLAVFKDCVMGLHECSDEHPCPMHFEYVGIRSRLEKTFQDLSIGELANKYSNGLVFISNP